MRARFERQGWHPMASGEITGRSERDLEKCLGRCEKNTKKNIPGNARNMPTIITNYGPIKIFEYLETD